MGLPLKMIQKWQLIENAVVKLWLQFAMGNIETILTASLFLGPIQRAVLCLQNSKRVLTWMSEGKLIPI